MENQEELLKYIVNNESKKTVGIICKRFELAMGYRDSLSKKEIEDLKSQVKESIYEAYRNLRDFIMTGKIVWDFKQKSKETDNGK